MRSPGNLRRLRWSFCHRLPEAAGPAGVFPEPGQRQPGELRGSSSSPGCLPASGHHALCTCLALTQRPQGACSRAPFRQGAAGHLRATGRPNLLNGVEALQALPGVIAKRRWPHQFARLLDAVPAWVPWFPSASLPTRQWPAQSARHGDQPPVRIANTATTRCFHAALEALVVVEPPGRRQALAQLLARRDRPAKTLRRTWCAFVGGWQIFPSRGVTAIQGCAGAVARRTHARAAPKNSARRPRSSCSACGGR